MARTQALDYDKRREAIMDAAAKLYADRGFHATSVIQIAEACGISKSLLYHYYPSKEDILFDVMDSHVQAVAEASSTIEKLDVPLDQKIDLLAARLMDLYVGAQANQKVLLNELVHLPTERRDTIVKHQRQVLDVVDRLIKTARPDLNHKRAERRAIGMLFFGMLNWSHTWFDANGPVKPRAFAAMVSQTFLGGLKQVGG